MWSRFSNQASAKGARRGGSDGGGGGGGDAVAVAGASIVVHVRKIWLRQYIRMIPTCKYVHYMPRQPQRATLSADRHDRPAASRRFWRVTGSASELLGLPENMEGTLTSRLIPCLYAMHHTPYILSTCRILPA